MHNGGRRLISPGSEDIPKISVLIWYEGDAVDYFIDKFKP